MPSQSPNGDSSPKGGAKSRLPPWGRWTRVSEDGEGKLPAAPSHGLCGSAGGLPSQSPNGDSSPEGGAKYVRYQKLAQSQVSPPPLGGAGAQWAPFSAWSPLPRRSVMDAAHWAASPAPAGESAPAGGGEGEVPAPLATNRSVAIHRNICYPKSAWDTMRESAKKRYKQAACAVYVAGPSQEV